MANLNENYEIGYRENLTGTSSDDFIDGKGEGDQINGGVGNDPVLFFDSKDNCSITTLSGITHILPIWGIGNVQLAKYTFDF